MTVLDGQITDFAIAGKDLNPNISVDLDGYDDILNVWNSPYAHDSEPAMTDQRAFNPADAHVRTLSGSMDHHYVEDYYHRIHVAPNPISLGDLLSEETREAYVWNAFFETKTLDDVTEEDTDGIDVSEPVSTPYDFAPLEEQEYTINVSISGPPTIDADVNFEFAVYTITLNITGSRVTLFTWVPQHKYKEQLAWLTHILRTRVGEQRIAMRDAPRQKFDHSYLLGPEQTSKLKMITYNWSYRTWGLPIWKEATRGVDAAAGATAIDFDTSYADYREDGLAVLWESEDRVQAVRITNVRADGIDIDPELAESWTNAFVAPLRKAITPDGIEFNRSRGKHTQVSASFIVADNVDLADTDTVIAWEPGIDLSSGGLYSPSNNYVYKALDSGTAGDVNAWPTTVGETVTDSEGKEYECIRKGYPQYRDRDVLTDGNVIIGDLSERIHRPIEQIDNGQGPITIETKQDYSNWARTVGKYVKTKEHLWLWRKWLHARRGKQKSFWLPSWNKDLILAKSIAASDTEIEIESLGIAIHGQLPLDCMLRLNDGTVFYRRITNAVELSGGNEQITIDSSLDQEVKSGDVDLWCFMDLVRFNADTIDLDHQNPYIMTNTIAVMRVPE